MGLRAASSGRLPGYTAAGAGRSPRGALPFGVNPASQRYLQDPRRGWGSGAGSGAGSGGEGKGTTRVGSVMIQRD